MAQKVLWNLAREECCRMEEPLKVALLEDTTLCMNEIS